MGWILVDYPQRSAIVLLAIAHTRHSEQSAGRYRPLLPAGPGPAQYPRLYAVAENIPKVRIIPAALRYSANARAGLATAYFSPSTASTSFVGIKITYADGAVEETGIVNMAAMGGPSTWGMAIGSNS